MRIVGILLALAACIYAALINIKMTKSQVRSLALASDCILLIKNALSIKNDSLPDIFESLSGQCSGAENRFFSDLSQTMLSLGNRNFSELWDEAVNRHFSMLNEIDLHELTKLSLTLGKCDTDSQIETLGNCHSYFSARHSKLNSQLPEKTRLVLGLWASAGAMTVILLI